MFSFFLCLSELLLHKAKPDLSLVDVNNNTALHLACSKVSYTPARSHCGFIQINTSVLIMLQTGLIMFSVTDFK